MVTRRDLSIDEIIPKAYTADPTEVGGGGAAFLYPGTGEPAEKVDLTRLESFIRPAQTVVRPGDPRTPERSELVRIADPKIQALIDEPQLAEIESDLARIKAQDPAMLEGDELKEYRAAEKRVEEYAFPSKPIGELPKLATMDDVKAFEQQLIQTKFGGTDPRSRNIYEEIMNLPSSFYRDYYESLRQPGDPIYDDLDSQTKSALQKTARSLEFDRLKQDIQIQQTAFNNAIAEATAVAKRSEVARKNLDKITKERLKTRKSERKAARKDVLSISKDLNEAQAELQAKIQQFGEGTPEVAAHMSYIRELGQALKDAQRTATATEFAGEAKRTGEEGGTLKPMTAEIAQEASRKFPGDIEAMAEWVRSQGYDPTISDTASMAKKKEPGPAGFQEEPSA